VTFWKSLVMGFLHQDAMVYRLLMNKKFLDIFFWPGETFVFVQARAAGKQIIEVLDNRADVDGTVNSGLASCLLIEKG